MTARDPQNGGPDRSASASGVGSPLRTEGNHLRPGREARSPPRPDGHYGVLRVVTPFNMLSGTAGFGPAISRRFDDDGFLFITGRLKEIINRGGEKDLAV